MSTPTVASTGRGAVISMSLDGTTWTTINQAKNISFSGPKASFADVTTLSSPGAVMESIPTVIDPGDATLTVVWNQTDAGQLMLTAQFYSQALCSFKVQYPAQTGSTTGPVSTFKAYVSEDALPSLDITKATEYTCSLKISGTITTTAGS